MAYTQVYEPETTFVLSSTVAWNADASALEVAGADVRPATALVYVDADLRVLDAAGNLIAGTLDEYVTATAGTIIPALYVSDEETAAALKFYLIESGLGDVFVVASHENAALVKDVASLNPVRGMVDFRDIVEADEDVLDEIIAATNGSHAKVCLISEAIATEENVQYLQGRCSTVWVAASSEYRCAACAVHQRRKRRAGRRLSGRRRGACLLQRRRPLDSAPLADRRPSRHAQRIH